MIKNTPKNLIQIKPFRHRKAVKFMTNFISGMSTIALISLSVNACRAETTPYTDPAQFTSIPFGSHSHWLQPWRAYMETVPAAKFLNGTGINWNVSNSANPELVARMLSKHGIRRARIEISWSNIDFDNETKLIPNNANNFRAQLLALKNTEYARLFC